MPRPLVATAPARSSWWRRAAPSWLVAALTYGGWLVITWHDTALPWWLVLPAGSVLIAWHGSLQHEAVHGQLAPWRWLNDGVASPPLALWLPFAIYRASHHTHHNFEILTLPWRDPESFYVDRATWARLPAPLHAVLFVNNTLLGRLVIGPPLIIAQFLWTQAGALRRGDPRTAAIWLWHLVGVGAVLAWVVGVCRIPLGAYVLLFVLPGTSLTLVRSFAEHKAAEAPLERTASVEAGRFFSLLFLNNNLHCAHHERPDLPWHALPAYYRAHRARLLRENGGLVYPGGYAEIARRFLWRPIDRPEIPPA